MKKQILHDHVKVVSRMIQRPIELIFSYGIPRHTAVTDLQKIAMTSHLRWTSQCTKKDYTILEHETSHFLWESNLNLLIRFGEAHPNYGDLAIDIYNILEDYRVEQLTGVLRKGSAYWFLKTIRDFWKGREAPNLASTMVVVRGGMPEKASPKWKPFVPVIQEALDKIQYTTPEGGYLVAEWFWKQMEDYVDAYKKIEQPEPQEGSGGKGSEGKPEEGGQSSSEYKQTELDLTARNSQDPLEEPSTEEGTSYSSDVSEALEGSDDSDDSTDSDDSEESKSNGAGEPEEKKTGEVTPTDLQQAFDIMKSIVEQGFDPLQTENTDSQGQQKQRTEEQRWGSNEIDESQLNSDNLDETLRQLKEKVDAHINEIERKMSEGEKAKDTIESHVVGDLEVTDYKEVTAGENGDQIEMIANPQSARRLQNIFEMIKNKIRQDLDIEGPEIDPDAFIQWKFDGMQVPPEIFEVDHEETGFKMHIYVDCSSSMGGSIETFKKVCATIMLATEKLPKVDVELFGWNTSHGTELYIQRAKTSKEVSLIHSNGSTPTHLALQYATERMIREKGDSKFILFFTDGMPTYGMDYYIGDAYCRKAVKKGRNRGIKYFGILADSWAGGRGSEFMNKAFGANYKHLPMQGAIKLMEKIVQQQIKAELQRS